MIIQTSLATSALLALTACATGMSVPARTFSQATLPASIQVPAGHRVAMETVGVGRITYECRARKNMAGAFEWVFAGPDARLLDRSGQQVGRCYGPPATWESMDGSKLTATQLAVAPATVGSIPLQLVQAMPALGMGAMQGVTYIQRVATQGVSLLLHPAALATRAAGRSSTTRPTTFSGSRPDQAERQKPSSRLTALVPTSATA